MAGRKVLLVEGTDDEHVMKHICTNRGIPHLDEVKQHGCYTELLKAIPLKIKFSEEEGDVVGVVIDADSDLRARWQSVRDRLVEVGYQDVPNAPNPNGTIVEPPDNSLLPKAGVWIMPDNKTAGILEDFLDSLIPQSDALRAHARRSVDSLPEQRFKDKHISKALIHTWLAWQEEPGRPYGTAIKAGFLDMCLPQADVLASWLKQLFGRLNDTDHVPT